MTATPETKQPAPKKAAASRTAGKSPARPKKAAEPKKAGKRRSEIAEQAKESAPPVRTVLKRIRVDRIDPDPDQPRKYFDPVKLDELAESIKQIGLQQAISVRYDAASRRYTLLMGERRWRAVKLAGLTEVNALVQQGLEAGDRTILMRAVAENVGRQDMTELEEAKAFQRLVEKNGYTLDEVAAGVGRSTAYVGWRIDLLKLCPDAQDAMAKGHLPSALAWYVSKLSVPNQTRFLARYARGDFPSTRDAESFVNACRAEEERRTAQGSFFVLADETAEPGGGSGQDALPGAHDLPDDEREQIIAARTRLTKRVDKLSTAGEILSELVAADADELAVLLAAAPGGVAGYRQRIEHLRDLTTKAIKNLRDAQSIAAVRAGAIEINPEATS